jgi:hypothetical protein
LDAGLLRSPQSAAVESHRRLRCITILCAGQARRSSRCMAQSLRSGVSPEAERVPTGKPSRRAGPVSPEVSSRHRRACADCFRSQLRRLGFGRLTRRDPGKAVRTYHEGCSPTFKTGTFYLAGSRNFLFGSDRVCREPAKWPLWAAAECSWKWSPPKRQRNGEAIGCILSFTQDAKKEGSFTCLLRTRRTSPRAVGQ